MTSKEIHEHMHKLSSAMQGEGATEQMTIGLTLVQAIWEVAAQLADLNERDSYRDL